MFQQKLLDNMHDAVVFVDRNCKILLWNRGAERLTGIASAAGFQQAWVPSLVGLHDEHGRPVGDAECPVHYAIQTGVQSLRRLRDSRASESSGGGRSAHGAGRRLRRR